MKQPMSYGKGKAAQIRKTRKMAASISGRSAVYRRIADMSETGAGTEDYQVAVTLVDGWSFSEETNITTRSFPSTAELMRGVSKTYRAQHVDVVETEQEEVEMTWQEKLEALTRLSK